MEDEKAVNKELTAYCIEPPLPYIDGVAFLTTGCKSSFLLYFLDI